MMSALPSHLAAHAAPGLVPGEPIAQFELGPLRNFVYLLVDWSAKQAAIVDPREELDGPLGALAAHGIAVTTVLLTHTHHDHVGGLPGLARRNPGLPIHVHAADRHRLPAATPGERIIEVSDGQEIRVGAHRVKALHAPGHSAGELCYLIAGNPPYLLTGDAIFIRDCGRTDFATGSDTEMFATLQKVRTLDPRTVILPGHHYKPECASTLERELRESPPFQCRSVDELRALP